MIRFDTNQLPHKAVLWVVAGLFALTALVGYWQYLSYYPATDDAYTQANVVNMAAQVSGPIAAISVQDHQHVKKGEVLFTIDPTPFQLEVAQTEALLRMTGQQVSGAEDAIQTANANVVKYQAELTNAQKNNERVAILTQKGLMSKASGDKAKEQLTVASAALQAGQSQLKQAQEQLGQLGANNAQIQAAQAKLASARLNLAHAQIIAPNDGVLVNFSLRPGTMVTANQPLFAIVEDQTWWVEANFKETDLKRIAVGQPAQIILDLYPNHVFKGVVQGIGAGSGAAFALLPPENATGNWVKVTQRFPVRINIRDLDPKYPLRVGASSMVTIDTRKTA